jgi:hypothetical protein
MNINKKNGYIALISVIVIGFVILSLLLSLTFISVNQTKNMIMQNQALRSYYLADACAHYALVKLQDDLNYAGNELVSVDSDSCMVDQVIGSGNANRVIYSSASIANHEKRIMVEVSVIKPKTIVKSWEEIYK